MGDFEKDFFIVATYPYNFCWTYSNKTTNTELYNFKYKNGYISSYDEGLYLKIDNFNISFVSNIEEASKVILELTNIATNFRIKYDNKYLRHKYGLLHCEKDDNSKIFKSDSTWIFIENKINPEHTFVIARYKEDVNWTRYLPGKVIIYNKTGDLYINNTRGNIEIKNLDNLGREGYTYLYYIIENYDKLKERTTFLQGYPFDHSHDLLELACMEKDYEDVQSLSAWNHYINDSRVAPNLRVINSNIKYLNGARYTLYPMNIFGDFLHEVDPFWPATINKYKYNKDPIRYFLEKCNMKDKITGNFYMAMCALFSAKKENIKKNTLQNYKDIMKELLVSNSQGGFEVYILERIWYALMI